MRLLALVVSVALVIGGFLPVFAQQSTGPATLENLLQDGGATPAQRPVAVDATESSTTAGRIQGAVTRPKDGIQHPDLNAAWTEYDKQIEAVAEAVEQAIERQLNAAAAAGDLDESLKWKTAGEQFKKDGRIPDGLDGRKTDGRPKPKPAKPDASPRVLIDEAQTQLAKAYEVLEKDLVKRHDLETAKALRDEQRHLALNSSRKPDDDVETRMLSLFIGRWRFENGNVEEIAPGGVYLINGNPADPWGGRWTLDLKDPKGPCVIRHANNGTLTHWYIDPDKPNVLVSEKGGTITRIGNSPRPKSR